MLSEAFYKLQRHVEELKLEAYMPTPDDVPTIGYGHTTGVKLGHVITLEQAEEYLREDAQDAIDSAAPYLRNIELSQHQFDAIISMVFNLGVGKKGVKNGVFRNYDGSDTGIYQALKRGEHKVVMHQMRRWNRQAGKVLNGLTTRRGMEEMLYLLGTKEEGECETFIPAY